MSDNNSTITVVKKRNWAFILYPESAPANWLEVLEKTGLPIAISPLHDKDINETTREPKKPHYHIILAYSGPTSFNVVSRFASSLNQPHPQFIDSIKGAYDYLTHANNPEKAQYSKLDIVCLNGFNIGDYVELTKSESVRICKEIHTIILENGFVEYSDLMNFLLSNDPNNELYDYAFSHTIFFNAFITSLRHKLTGNGT